MQSMRAKSSDEFPLWLIASIMICAGFLIFGSVNDIYKPIFRIVARGLGVTAFVTLVSFFFACILGLLVALAGISKWYFLRQLARFYVEVVRGVPVLVLLFYMAFVAAPAIVEVVNFLSYPIRSWSSVEPMELREFSLMWRAMVALMISYSAYIAEIFRAGIVSVDRGQIEAARVLGLNRFQVFRDITFYQGFRTILPPLGNDFIAMIKDSALVSALGVADVTQMGKIYSSGSFRFFETYNTVAITYLVLTLGLSLALRALEKRLRKSEG